MSKLRILQMSVIAVFLLSVPLYASERHVPSQYPTIQAAIDACSDGDEVIVSDGVYAGPGNNFIAITKSITLKSQNGPERTIIDGGGESSVGFTGITLANPAARIGGFTITNFKQEGDQVLGAVNLTNGAIIGNCIIKNNSCGIFVGPYEPVTKCYIANCIISDNLPGGGIAVMSDVGIINCLIANNYSATGGGGVGCSGYLYSILAEIYNCTIANNVANSFGGGIYCSNNGEIAILNSIIQNNISVKDWGHQIAIATDSGPYSTINCDYSNVPDNYEPEMYIYGGHYVHGSHNTNASPVFASNGVTSFYLSEDSPGIDAGTMDVFYTEGTDFFGNDRAVNTIDMGAFEYHGIQYAVDTPVPNEPDPTEPDPDEPDPTEPDPDLTFCTIASSNISNRNGLTNIKIKGEFASDLFSGQPVEVRVGSYTKTLSYLTPNKAGTSYTYKGYSGSIKSAKFDLKKGTFQVVGSKIAIDIANGPLEIEVSFTE